MCRALVVVAALAGWAGRAHAEDGATVAAAGATTDELAVSTAPDEDISTQRRLGAIGAAILPGLVVHGAGSWVVHEKRAARRLAIVGWVGLGAIAVGGASIGISGGNPTFTLIGLPFIIGGTGVAVPTWFSDIWVAAGGRRLRGESHAESPWCLDVGTTYLHDGFRERGFARTAGRVTIGRVGVGASTLLDVEGTSWTADVEGRVRVLGTAATGETVADASNLYVRAAVRRHVDDDDEIAISTAEAEVGTRVDLQRVDPILAGNFVEISLGMGIERVRYVDAVSDTDSLFLGRFAWGLYLGRRSELAVFYDHRRDSLVGGLAAWRAAGFVGSVGAALDLRLAGPVSLAAELDIGNGWVTTAAVRYHGGPR